MLIYSIVPMESIMKDETEKPYEGYEETELDGIKMVVQRNPGHSEAKIIRLISSNPQDYLNPKYFPGEMIHYYPQFG